MSEKPGSKGSYIRSADRSVKLLTEPFTTDSLGTSIIYYTSINGHVNTSTSVRALCGMLGSVTLNDVALAELLSFGLVMRDETLLNEIKSIPAYTTLHPDGTLVTGEGPRSSSSITSSEAAVQNLSETLSQIVTELELRWDNHCVGFTGGKDSRILAALEKKDPGRWHWLSVSGRDDAEFNCARLHANRLGLCNYRWMEWTSDFLNDSAHRRSADLSHGIGAVSDHTLLRSYFEGYRKSALGRESDDTGIALWIGTLADGLFAGTFLSNPASTIWDALQPRTAHLDNVLDPECMDRFRDKGDYYHSNPFEFTPDREEEVGYFIRLLTRGRFYLCKSLSCFDDVCPSQINPYLHPAIVELALKTDSRLFERDALRDGVLAGIGPDLCTPSAYGYIVPGYSESVFRALQEETRRCSFLSGRINSELIEAMSGGRFPALEPDIKDEVSNSVAEYRIHSKESQVVSKSLRDYEHLLLYITFLNLLQEDGITIS